MALSRRLGPNNVPVSSGAGRRPPASRLTGHAIARMRREPGKQHTTQRPSAPEARHQPRSCRGRRAPQPGSGRASAAAARPRLAGAGRPRAARRAARGWRPGGRAVAQAAARLHVQAGRVGGRRARAQVQLPGHRILARLAGLPCRALPYLRAPARGGSMARRRTLAA